MQLQTIKADSFPPLDGTQHAGTGAARDLQSPLLAIAPGPTRILSSSLSLPWKGLLIERHICSPGYRKLASTDWHVISLTCGQQSHFELLGKSGKSVSCRNRPGMLTITPAGSVPDLRLHTSSEFLHCALEEEFTKGVLAELDRPPAEKPIFRPGIRDNSIQHILTLLNEELETEKPLGCLYVDFLAHALATRYLMLDCPTPLANSGVTALPSRLLRRVHEKIEANLDTDLKLESLAAESGYSRAHFLRMFRAATGVTPHQYVLDLRIHRAKQCLGQKSSTLIDVALACGFSSQSHMTSIFRQHVGVTPARFRHGLWSTEVREADRGKR